MRHRKVTTWPRVQMPLGSKAVSVLPVVMPFSTAQAMASRKMESSATSVKGNSGSLGVGVGGGVLPLRMKVATRVWSAATSAKV